MAHSSVIIIGAPRSGTNMLRDMLVTLPGVGTWPCDEINYIWRHGNVKYPSDEFTPEMATIRIQSYIRQQFEKISLAGGFDTVVEKTCANSLRVGFVNRIIGDAKYVFIVRDGMDAVGSACKRWKAKLDIPYILQKAKFVPPFDMPYYASRFMVNHGHRLISREKRLSLWGPAVHSIEELLKQYSLLEVCAFQWRACVEKAEMDFAGILPQNLISLKYEEFVADPVFEFARLANFLGKHVSESMNTYLEATIRKDSVGKGRKYLGNAKVEKIRPLITDTLKHYGYE